jgi:predicted nucleic acid-binding Zn ribbon protein
MPTYVYKFVETGETIEVQQGFSEESLTEAIHPATGVSMRVKKVFTPVGVTFKGGGFYKTDSRGGSSKSTSSATDAGGSGSNGDSTSTSTSTTSTDSSTSAAPAKPAPAAASSAKSD